MDEQQQRPIIDITSEPSPKRPSSGQYTSVGGVSSGSHETPLAARPVEGLLKRRRRAFVILLLLIAAAGGFWVWRQPSLYLAAGSILVSRLGPVPAPVTEGELASEIELIRSQVNDLPGSAAGAPRVAESLQAADARRNELKKRVQIRVLDGSQVIEVSFTDPSRKAASDSVNLLMELYLQQRFRIFSTPMHMVNIEAEEASLTAKAEQARRDLAAFDKRTSGSTARDEHLVQNHHRITIEERVFDLKGSVRSQEEVLRVLKLRGAEGSALIDAEAKLAGLKAQLKEIESAWGPVAKADIQTRSVAAQREELKQRAELAASQASQVTSKIREARLQGTSLQSRILSRAEPVLIRPFELSWWKILLVVGGALLLAWFGTWLIDLVDRPIYHDDDFTSLTGVPPVKTRSASAGR
jgi:uncharacterized protein involved in exopolysaccharide biosynthesis